MKTFMDNLYMAWTIARKDIGDALKHKGTRVNILLMLVMAVFFYWVSTVRPWDKSIEVVVYDEGDFGLLEGSTELSDDYEIRHIEVSSPGQMQRNMRQNIGASLYRRISSRPWLRAGNRSSPVTSCG